MLSQHRTQSQINGRVASGRASGIKSVPNQTSRSIHCGEALGAKKAAESYYS